MSSLQRGRIIKAEIADHSGHRKVRPAVIASPVPDDDDGEIVVFAITGVFRNPMPPSEIFLPADPDGRFGTLVKKDCVVACHWPDVIRKRDILGEYGELSPPQIRIMAHFYRNLRRSP